MFFAAKAAAERQARKRAELHREEGRVLGVEEGMVKERERIMKVLEVLEERGMPLTPEQAKVLAGEGDNR